MIQVTPPTGNSKGYPEPEQVDRLIAVATNSKGQGFYFHTYEDWNPYF